MGDICKALAQWYLAIGSIGTLYLSFALGRTAEIGYYGAKYSRNWFLTIVIFLGAGFSVAMVSAALYTLGEISDEVNRISYKLSTYPISSEDKDKKKMVNGGWKCPTCGKTNNSYETTCKCGALKI